MMRTAPVLLSLYRLLSYWVSGRSFHKFGIRDGDPDCTWWTFADQCLSVLRWLWGTHTDEMPTGTAYLWAGIAHLWERHPAFFLRSFGTCLERKPWAAWSDPTVGPAWGRGLDCSAPEDSSNVDNPVILWTAGQYFLGKKLYSRVWESALDLI